MRFSINLGAVDDGDVRLAIRESRSRSRYVAVATGFALFFPLFYQHLGTVGMGVINGGLILLLTCAVVGFPFRRLPTVALEQRGSVALLLILLALVYYLAALLGTMSFLSGDLIVRDVFELHRPVLHSLSFVFFWKMVQNRAEIERLERLLVAACFGFFAFAAVQLSGLANSALLLYAKESLVGGYRLRLAVPMLHPYDLAFIVSLPSYILLARTLRHRSPANTLLFILTLALMVLTQSRSVIGAFFVGLFVVFPGLLAIGALGEGLRLQVPKRTIRWLFLMILFVAASGWVLSNYGETLQYLVSGFDRVLTGTARDMTPLQIRREQIAAAVSVAAGEQGILRALFGSGPSKVEMEMVESSYAFYLFRLGTVGTLIVFLLPLVVVIGRLLTTPGVLSLKHSAAPLLFGMLVWYLTTPLASIGNPFPEGVRISFLYWGLMAVAIRARHLPDLEVVGQAR